MDRQNTYSPEKITTETISDLDERVIERCYDESNLYLQGLVELGREIQNKCITLLGWIIAAISSLIGCLFYTIINNTGTFIRYCLIIYGLIAAAMVACKIISGALYNSFIGLPGEEPSHIIRKEIRPYADLRTKEQAYKYILGWELEEKQYKIAVNEAENDKMVNTFRSAIKYTIACLLASPAVLGIALLVRALVI